jgi:hypothetical protein
MAERELFEDIAAEEGWTDATQVEILLQYIGNQQSHAGFEDFLDQMRSE